MLLGLFALGTAVLGRPRGFALRTHQVWRQTAERPFVGVPAFGFLMGLGWWTNISSVLMWLALVLAAISGHGIHAGVAFGIGRAAAFWIGATVLSSYPDLGRVVTALLSVRWRSATRVTGGIAGALMLFVAASDVIRT